MCSESQLPDDNDYNVNVQQEQGNERWVVDRSLLDKVESLNLRIQNYHEFAMADCSRV